MNFKAILLCCLLGVLMLQGVNTKVTRRTIQRVPRTLNVTQPLITMKNSYEKFKNSFDLVNIVSLLFSWVPSTGSSAFNTALDPVLGTQLLLEIVQDCLLPILQPSSTTTTPAPGGPSLYPDLNAQLTKAEIQVIVEKLSYIQTLPNFGIEIRQEQEDNLCESPVFKTIHDFVWKEEKQQFPDLVNFLYRFGYPKIYDNIIESYKTANCSAELIKDIENLKPGQGEKRRSHILKGYNSSSNVRENLLQERNSPAQEPQCNILEIIFKLPGTGLIQLGSFIETVIYEFNTSPDLHFLIGKLQEPIKGVSVREFHLMPEVKGLLEIAHKKLTESPVWKELFLVIKEVTNIDLFTINIFDFLFSLVEFLIWGTIFPPPF